MMSTERFDELCDVIRLYCEGSRRSARERCRHHFSHAEVVFALEWLAYFPEPSERERVAEYLTN